MQAGEDMGKHKVRRIFLLFLFVLTAQCATRNASSQVMRQDVMEKAQKVKELIRMKQARGEDVSAALFKARQAKRSFKSGDVSTADRLLDEALVSLGESSEAEVKRPMPSLQYSQSTQIYEPEGIEKTISLNLDLKKAYLVSLDPRFKRGKDISGFDRALKMVPAEIKDGLLSLKIGAAPIFILEDKPAIPFRRVEPTYDSPFGFHPAKVEDMKDPYQYAHDIGVSWHRMKRYFIWPLIQKDLTRKEYDWTFYDHEIQEAQGLYLLCNIIAGPPLTSESASKIRKQGVNLNLYMQKDSYLPVNQKAYMDFVTATVERYDGDGINDMPGLTRPVKYWQIGNEPHPKVKDFAEFVKMTSTAIKKADPTAKVVIGGALLQEMQNPTIFDMHFLKILEDLKGGYIDVIDFHWGGEASGNYRGYKDIYDHLRRRLSEMGFPPDMPVWITEMSSYSGDPVKLSFQPWDPKPQTESQQASDLIKRYVFGTSIGIKKIFWAWGMVEGFKNNDSYFDHTGLIYDGKFSDDDGYGVKKLAYYSYKLMTGLLDGSDWNSIGIIKNGEDDIYAYKFIRKRTGKPVYVVWWDYSHEKTAR